MITSHIHVPAYPDFLHFWAAFQPGGGAILCAMNAILKKHCNCPSAPDGNSGTSSILVHSMESNMRFQEKKKPQNISHIYS